MYRIIYGGSGQCSGTFETLAEAKRAMLAQIEYDTKYKQSSRGTRIQQYLGDGEWGKVQ
jgi:hypothetical protein